MTPVHPILLDLGKLVEEARERLRYRGDELSEEELARLYAYITGVLHAAKIVGVHLSTEHMVQ